MHETQVQSLVWADPTCHRATKPCARTIEPVLYSLGTATAEPTHLELYSATRKATTISFPLWFSLFIPSGAISLFFSSSILDTYQPGGFIFQCPNSLPFHTVHGVLKARMLKWFVNSFSSGLCFVRTLHHNLSDLGGRPCWAWLIASLSYVRLWSMWSF